MESTRQKNLALRMISVVRWILDAITVTCFIGMFVLVLGLVFMRFVLRLPFLWGEEAARYLMVISIFLAISIGVKEKVHLNVGFFVEKLPAKISLIVVLFADLVTIFGYVFFSYLAITYVQQISKLHQRSAALNIPTWTLYCFIAIGFVLCSAESFLIFCKDLQKIRLTDNQADKKDGEPQ